MKQAIIVTLLMITAAANFLTAEAFQYEGCNSAQSQNALGHQASEAWQLPSTEAWPPITFMTAGDIECGTEVTVNHWGWVSNGNDVCATVCGPCNPYEKIVGQVIYECDGTTTQWGLTDCYFTTTTHARCGTCGGGGEN